MKSKLEELFAKPKVERQCTVESHTEGEDKGN